MKKLLLILILFTSQSLYAQSSFDPDSVYVMNELEVIYNASSVTPVSFFTLSKMDIEKINVGQEPSLILRKTPGFTAYSDAGSNNGYSYFRLRGIDQTRINMTLDGIPLNEPEDQGVYFSNYPDIFTSVSSVQIQRGVGMTQNGTASYAGSIQLSSPNLWNDKSTNIGLGYGSYNSHRLFIEHNTGIAHKIGLYARVSNLNSDGYRDNVFNKSCSLFLSTGYFGSRFSTKLVSFIGTQENGMGWLGVPIYIINETPTFNVHTTDEDDKFLQSLISLQSKYELSSNFMVQNTTYYNFLDGNYDFDLDTFLGLTNSVDATNLVFNFDLQSHWLGTFFNLLYTNNGTEWVSGIHMNSYQRRHIGSELEIGELYQNTGYKRELSGHQRIQQTIGNATLFGDLQLRSTTFDYSGNIPMETQSWLFLNHRVGISYQLGKVNIYSNIGYTGREPTRNDMFGGEDDLVELYQTDPEFVTNYELGVRLNNTHHTFNVNGYLMNFKNEITLSGEFGPNGIALTQNVERSYRSGIEAKYEYSKNKLDYSIFSTLSKNQIRDQGNVFEPILSPTFIVNGNIDYDLSFVSVGVSARYQGESFINFSNTERIDSYIVTDVRLSKSFNLLDVSLFVNNVTDEVYFNNGYVDMFDGEGRYHISAPRNYFVSLSYRF